IEEPERVLTEFSKAGNAGLQGDTSGMFRHLFASVPLIGGPLSRAAEEFDKGQYPEAVGHATAPVAMAAAPEIASQAGKALPAVDAAVTCAVKGGAKAAVEPVNYGHLRLPVPAPVAGAGAGGYAASQLGLPHEVGAAVGAAVPIVRGAIKGARAALAERLNAATEALAADRPLTSA